MTNREAKIKALEIASIVINELEGSDCTDSLKVKNELHEIAISLAKKKEQLIRKIIKEQ